jgi:hypothetical protein
MQPRLLYLTPPPSSPLTSHCVHRWRCTLRQYNNPRQQQGSEQRQTKETGSFFLSTTHRFPQSFSLWQKHVIQQHCSVFVLFFRIIQLQSGKLCFYNIIFLLFLVYFFFLFLFLLDNVIYFFFSMHLCMYLINSFWNFCTLFNIEQQITKVNDWRRHFDCPVPVLLFTIRNVIININTLVFNKQMDCFVSSKMVFFYRTNFIMPTLTRQHINIIYSFTGHVPVSTFFFRAPSLISASSHNILYYD